MLEQLDLWMKRPEQPEPDPEDEHLPPDDEGADDDADEPQPG